MFSRPTHLFICLAASSVIGCGTSDTAASGESATDTELVDSRADAGSTDAGLLPPPRDAVEHEGAGGIDATSDASSVGDSGGAPTTDAAALDAGEESDASVDVTDDTSSDVMDDVSGDVVDDTSTGSEPPFSELYEQDLLRYVGTSTPDRTAAGRYDSVTHTFEGDDGPRCITGDEFFVTTRDGWRDDLMIFLQAGSDCGPADCDLATNWPRAMSEYGILNPVAAGENPADGFDLGYVPQCDGSLFTGDAEYDTDGDGTVDRSFRGLRNLTAALDVIRAQYPSPTRILLVGNSSGGFGAHFALPIVRAMYPDVAIDLLNDSGIGVHQPGALADRIAYWNASAFFPPSCDDCISDEGRMTGYHAYQLREDPNVRLGFISSRQDEVVCDKTGLSGAQYEVALLESVATMKEQFGDRFNSIIVNGTDHTFVVRALSWELAETSVDEWVGQFLDDDGWVSVAE